MQSVILDLGTSAKHEWRASGIHASTYVKTKPRQAGAIWQLAATFWISLLLATPACAFTLRVCADPNNLPFSNQAGEGFENKIVDIVADEMHADVQYTWWAERRGFLRNTLNAGKCDLVPGTVAGLAMLRTTEPYYRSTYVFVTRAADRLAVDSFDDPVLEDKRIGVQLIGDDGANSPPAHALTMRGIVGNVRGYPVYGDYGDPAPGRAIIDALDRGDIDVAVVWGPTAGFFALHNGTRLDLTPVAPAADARLLPMAFDISMGVRKGDQALGAAVEGALKRRRADIDAVLKTYGVPLLERAGAEARLP